MTTAELEKQALDPMWHARLYGYALGNQLQYVKRGSEEERVYKILEQLCRSQMGVEVARIRRQLNWTEEFSKTQEAQALRELDAATTGWHDHAMQLLTDVKMNQAPNFFATIDLSSVQDLILSDSTTTLINPDPPHTEIVDPGHASDAILGKWKIKYSGRYDIPENDVVVVVQRAPGEYNGRYEGYIFGIGQFLQRNGFRPGQLYWKLTLTNNSDPNRLCFNCQQYDRHQTGSENERGYYRNLPNFCLNLQTQTIQVTADVKWIR